MNNYQHGYAFGVEGYFRGVRYGTDSSARLVQSAEQEAKASPTPCLAKNCHRLGREQDCAADIFRLLRSGGACLDIDMSNRFPAFRSRLKGSAEGPAKLYLTSFEEYASPFKAAGLSHGLEIENGDVFLSSRSRTIIGRLVNRHIG